MDRSEIQNLIGGTVIDSEGKDAGKIGMIYLDDETNEPDWVSVNTGLFGNKETFVPLEGSRADGDNLHVPFTKDKIKDAPNIDADEHLDVEHEEKLYRHYGRDYGTDRDGDRDGHRATDNAGVAGGVGTTHGRLDNDHDGRRDDASRHGRRDDDHDDSRNIGAAGTHGRHEHGDHNSGRREGRFGERDADVVDRDRDRVAGDSDQRGEGVTLHEERLDVGTERRETGTARLRKYVVTEERTVTVPVTHEEVRVEREPVSGHHVGDAKIGEEVQEVKLHEEVPVVDKEAVATEEVRLSTDRVTDEQQISEEVRREEVDVDGGGKHESARRRDGDVDDARRRDGDVDDARRRDGDVDDARRRDGDVDDARRRDGDVDDRSMMDKAKDKLS